MNGTELWLQCVEWLVNIGALPRHHRACERDAKVFDLAQTLRDGVILCNVLNILAPGVVDESKINFRAQMSEFLCIQNIRIAIYTLQTYFRIPHPELFKVEDLYDLDNFPQVLHTLSCLSCIPEYASRYPAFQPSTRQISRHRSSFDGDGEDIYSNLPELANERSLADEDEDLYASVPEEKEESIYGSLIDVKKSTDSQKTDKRECCIHEIVDTENNYVFTLDLMVDQYMQPLRGIMDDQDLRTIFSNVELLRPIHREFCNELVKLKQSNQTAKFSEPFKRYMDKFLVYGQYCSHMADAQDLLDEVMRMNEKVRIKVEDCQQQSSRPKFKLREFLCVPMQRILKYHLLVKDLHKFTPDSHLDKENLAESVKLMRELSMYINEVKRDSEELIKINKIEANLDEYSGIPLRLYGRVQRDGQLKVKFSDDKNLSNRYLFLFDKALFMTKPKNDSYIVKDLVRLEDMQLDEMPNQKQNKAKWVSCLKLFSMTQGPTYHLHCKSTSEKDKWVDAFKASFDNISPQALKGKKHSFAMQTFPEPTQCDSCKNLLKGIFYQGYECTVTNARCHKRCLADTLKLIENNSIGASTTERSNGKVPPVPDRGRKKPSTSPTQDAGATVTIGSLSYKAHRAYNGSPSPPFANASFITFQIGQLIDVLEQVTPDWWKGKSYTDIDRIGFFPASHVIPQKPHTRHNGQTLQPADEEFFDKPRPCPSSPEQLRNYYWYAGDINRSKAEQLLWDTPSGTFLIRKKDPQSLVISLKYLKDVKHIKILQTDDNMHYVAECKNFRSVQDLVSFYQANSLSGFFLGLETKLKYSYRDPVMFPGRAVPSPSPTAPMRPTMPHPDQRSTRRPPDGCNGGSVVAANGRTYDIVGVAKAKFDFEARSEQELSLRAGQLVNIISKAGQAHGWWKGERNGQIGYFPTTFVEE